MLAAHAELHFLRKKCAKSTVLHTLGALSGIGGNPTFCADKLFGDFGSVARIENSQFGLQSQNRGVHFGLQLQSWVMVSGYLGYSHRQISSRKWCLKL